MKKLLLIIAVVIANLSLSSCTYDDVAENEALYDTQGGPGEDGDIELPEEPEY
ncbi:hypothetical protein [Sinomicrobium weinanense]|uniref:Secreted protein n=1 Tax=Sinomicrobium weinanense TaxID=2842200 RepID=A0A926JR35_9FLAO|nr:hypothetical protein [Sinomicrobium weinanense]MBC9795898.1 hypothetical protein [Sinomicrobium weinanense]MBU3124723.1 hypothetical protein [Sinomicrobium weinanense]